jgi:regulator of sirC expression with transglutaminase-like and TPR domain
MSLDFVRLAATETPPLDTLALALAAEFRQVDAEAALAELDRLGSELAEAAAAPPPDQVDALRGVLAERHGFLGDRDEYDHPDNSMLDLVLVRRAGLPILLSVVYVEVARRAGIALAGVGLPGHFVVGRFGVEPPILLDPFSGGRVVTAEARPDHVRPWGSHETALRMLNNLLQAYSLRGDLGNAILAAKLRLALPAEEEDWRARKAELKRLQARLN